MAVTIQYASVKDIDISYYDTYGTGKIIGTGKFTNAKIIDTYGTTNQNKMYNIEEYGWVYANQVSVNSCTETTTDNDTSENSSTLPYGDVSTSYTNYQQTTTTTSYPTAESTSTTSYRPVSDFSEYRDQLDEMLQIDTLQGIHGMPYQYLPTADVRLDGSANNTNSSSLKTFGRVYADKIVSRLPLLLMTPGKPLFMTGFTTDEQKSIITQLVAGAGDAANNFSDGLQQAMFGSTGGKYYSFDFNYAEYYKYVDSMAHTMAVILDLGDETLEDGSGSLVKLRNFNWSDYTNSALTGAFSSKEFVAFYVNADTQISEDMSNSTGESMLANTVNSQSDMAREIAFLLGEGAGVNLSSFDSSSISGAFDEFNGMLDKVTSGKNILSDITSKFKTIASGAKLLFPEIWNDSSFSRSYNVSINLKSPDGDKMSWYLNVAIPLVHLMAFALPAQTQGDCNQGYKAPFLIRAFYKGLFNCDMGIITSMSINKGNDSAWTLDNLPLEVNVEFNIKELYQAMSMTSSDDVNSTTIMDNTALLDYLMNTCGINIAKPEIARKVEIYLSSMTDKLDIKNKIMNGVDVALSKWIYSIKNLGK